MADILCPNCGMPNPEEQNLCSFCSQPLRASKDGESIRPGDMPTKKITADLEPVLPHWLKEARQKARQSAEETAAEQAAAAQSASQQESAPDLLAGLEATAREEEQDEIPEWMRGAASTSASTPAKHEKEKEEESFPRRQEIRWEEEPPEDEIGGLAKPPQGLISEDGLPLWMKGLEEESSSEKEEVSSWLSKQETPPAPEAPISPFPTGSFQPGTGELARWLDSLKAESAPETEAGAPPAESTPDWVANLPSEDVPSAPAQAESAPLESSAFDWLKEESSKPFAPFQESQASAENAPAEDFGGDLDLPAWMKPAAETPAQDTADSGLSAWMKKQDEAPPPQEHVDQELPDWMKTPEGESSVSAQDAGDSLPTWLAANASPNAEPPSHAPAFVSAEGQPANMDVDDLFAVEMPDWLANIGAAEPKAAPTAPQAEQPREESIAPADLPSWVQAMRPVETALPGLAAAASASDQPVEDQGPLAGLRGVLSALPGFAPSSKPKPISLTLQPTSDQHTHAALLEQMLISETSPKPIRTASAVTLSNRALRWVVTAILSALILLSQFAGTQLIDLPSILPGESDRIPGVLDSLPPDAPALLIFDYEPALAGELEAAAAPILDRMIGLRHPRFTILSSSPTGPALAGRFMRNIQSRYNYQRGQNYINLGYLPGGTAGILGFSVDPHAAILLDASGASVWDSAAAQGITTFSDYAVIVLLTDRAETARAWVEQTSAQRGGRPFIIVSSAQAAPMILPYFASGQVSGLVSGLRGGAAFELGSGLNTIRDFWDSYNLALLAASAMIVLGGLWNFALGIRSRRQGMDEV